MKHANAIKTLAAIALTGIFAYFALIGFCNAPMHPEDKYPFHDGGGITDSAEQNNAFCGFVIGFAFTWGTMFMWKESMRNVLNLNEIDEHAIIALGTTVVLCMISILFGSPADANNDMFAAAFIAMLYGIILFAFGKPSWSDKK